MTSAFNLDMRSRTWVRFSGVFNPFAFSDMILIVVEELVVSWDGIVEDVIETGWSRKEEGER